ncbi:unnamed protein product [Ilex paraguariensis]|uniref:Pentatricopeptide repeat-containing protein n=1 Tax=Ilex paraguariensis TaxID=185542 RepID=A0ABC8RGE5_9AQUA
MAIASPPDWSLACINCSKKSYKPTFNSTCTALPILSLLLSNSRVLIARSSSCSSPVLEDAPNDPPMVQLDLKFQDLRLSSIPESKDLNGFISTLLKDPQTEELAFEYYEKAKEKTEFRPQKSTLKHLIRYLISSKDWSSILSVTQDFENFKVLPDSSTCCRLISSCIKARKFKLVHTLLEVFKYDTEIAVLAFDSAMKGYNKLHMYSSTIGLYENMKSACVFSNPGCYCKVMEAYLKVGNNERVVSLFQEFENRRIVSSSTEFLSEIYWMLCESLGRSGKPYEALEFFREMTQKGVPENPSFYSSLICSFASTREVKMAEELLKEAEKNKMLKDPAVFLKLVLLYVEEGLMEKTLEIVAVMKRVKSRVSDCIFCAIVNGFSKRRGVRATIKVYEELLLQGCDPGQVTYASILNVYCRIGQYSKAELVFSEMEQKGFDKCVVAYSSMVAMYGKTGRLRDAIRLVAKMKERGCQPNVWIYNSLLDMNGKVLNLKQVEKIWKEMKRRKVVPDKVSYTSVISAYSKAREFDLCVKHYQEFRLNGGVIDRAMAGIMVGVFSKMNRVDELVKLLRDMKMEGSQLDGRLYRSALNALRDAGLLVQAKWLQDSFHAT